MNAEALLMAELRSLLAARKHLRDGEVAFGRQLDHQLGGVAASKAVVGADAG